MELGVDDRGSYGLPVTSVDRRREDELLESSDDEGPKALRLRRFAKSAAIMAATVVVSPLTLIAKAEERLSGRGDLGASNFSRYGSGPTGADSHPNLAGNRAATEVFVPFLNRVVRRAGIANEPAAMAVGEEAAVLPAGQES